MDRVGRDEGLVVYTSIYNIGNSQNMFDCQEWSEPQEVSISQIKTLLDNGYEVEVDSPDGFVPVSNFINKGVYEEYCLLFDDENMEPVVCNADHLFETTVGWVSAQQLEHIGKKANVLTRNGFMQGRVIKTGKQTPIVDITVDHKNHRYYTNNVSSHNTGVGKSLAMCHMAAANLLDGRDVLYITMEMSEEKIAERIDANLLDVNIQDIEDLSKDNFMDRVGNLRAKTTGKLIVKEYPTGQANASHFRALLNDLKLKKRFEPDIIYIDYLNICASARLKNMGGAINSYTYVKAIAEEIRGLGVEFDLPIVSATQTTRTGYANSDPGLEDTSESFGLPATADLMIALISSEELEAEGKILVKQLKNRYNDLNTHKRFVVGVDRSKMRLFDTEEVDGMLTNQDAPIMDHNQDDRFDGISQAAKEMRF